MKTTRFLITFNILLILTGLFIEPSGAIISNLRQLIITGDTLITDYFVTGSIGSSFLNAGLVGLMSIILLKVFKNESKGIAFASVMLMSGFSFFGKNIYNIWPIILGTYVFARFKKKDFGDLLPVSFFATSFSPIVSEFAFVYQGPLLLRIALSWSVGISVGFVVVLLASRLYSVHKGYNLYNVGFTIGILSTVYVSLVKSFGYTIHNELIWYRGDTSHLYLYFTVLFIILGAYALISLRFDFRNYKSLLKTTGHSADYLSAFGFETMILNMSTNALFAILFLYFYEIPMNGPIIGGVLTIAGFSASGKHIRNIYPIFLGALLGSLTKTWSITDPAVVLSVLFGTGLAPIAGAFGPLAGIIASYINSSVVLNTGALHGGLNLYNTGFAIGITCAVVVPLFEVVFKLRKYD